MQARTVMRRLQFGCQCLQMDCIYFCQFSFCFHFFLCRNQNDAFVGWDTNEHPQFTQNFLVWLYCFRWVYLLMSVIFLFQVGFVSLLMNAILFHRIIFVVLWRWGRGNKGTAEEGRVCQYKVCFLFAFRFRRTYTPFIMKRAGWASQSYCTEHCALRLNTTDLQLLNTGLFIIVSRSEVNMPTMKIMLLFGTKKENTSVSNNLVAMQ